jgi:tripartite-type tricarboxylate transporter receptor subunit TctC
MIVRHRLQVGPGLGGKSMRRLVTCALALAGSACLTTGGAFAADDNYPSRQVTIITGFAAGSGADIYSRYFAKQLEDSTKQTVVVENKPGGFGSIAAVAAARATPDGYTLFIGGADTFSATPYVFKQSPFDPRKDFIYVAPIFGQGFTMLVSAKSPYKSLADLTAAMKQKGAKSSYATSNNVSTILAEVYKQSAGLETVQVRYKATADVLNDLESGSIDFVVSDPVFGLARARDGSGRLLAISTAKPISSMADVKPFKEQGVDVDLNIWWLVAAPAKTPQPVVDKLNALLTKIAKSDATREFVGKNGGEPLTADSSDATYKMVEREINDWARYVKVGNIEPQ